MDSRRQTYAPAHAPPPPNHPPPHGHNPHTPVNYPPPPHFSHSQPPSTTAQPHQPHPLYPGPPTFQQSVPPGPSLPPIQAPYAPPGAPPNPHTLPPLQHQYAAQPPHEQRESVEYNTHNSYPPRSGHATPAPVSRSFSHDSSHQQRTPTTPAHPGPHSFHPAPAPDGAQQQAPSHPMDHGGHHGYPPVNGVPHGLPPPHGPPPHHEQPPSGYHSMTPVMENHPGYPPPQSQPMYSSQSYGPASNNFVTVQKRKQMRATQCRQRKQKCDEGNPCSFCKENNLSCQYRDTPPAKTDKNMEKLLHYMESHSAALSHLTSKIDDFDRRIRRVEHVGLPAPSGAPEPVEREPSIAEEPTKQAPELDDHRTAPHKLILLWPSVKPLLQDAAVNINDGYVMEAEDRGILRIWTRGEGIDEHDGTQPGGPASPARSEESGEGSAASPPDGLWGIGFPQTPISELRRSDPYSIGGLRADGAPDLDVQAINTLYDSYMKHIHIMHPFLDKQRLRKLFDHFIKRYSTGAPSLRHKFAVGNGSDGERPLKRQRSNGSTVTGMLGHHDPNNMRKEPTERSPGNAIVWLVLALGKICLHREPLPGTVPDGRLNTNTVISHQLTGNPGLTGSSPISASIKLQPNELSPKTTPTTQPTPPNMDGVMRMEPRSRRSSMDGLQVAGPRNLDVVPGLVYYAKAAEIMGDQGDGNDLVHAQMFLLAGLYKGQLARVKESMSWFIMAGRAIRMLLDRYKLYNDNYWTAHGDIRKQHEKGQARIKDKRHNLIVFASWTCLQLESDILAEMRLPSSGIGNVENMLLMPHNMPDSETENYEGLEPDPGTQESYGKILLFYTAQMFLRKRLNQVHKEMYGDQCLNQPLSEVKSMLSGHEDILTYWRETLPLGLRWNDSDPPSTDILEARLRAKYWGARYIINRPFLDYALHIMPHAKDGLSIESVAKDCNGNPRDKAEVHLFKAIETMGESEIWEASKRCIDAAMQSTVSLDGVPERLIVTNIHGTAHAQFGNMLVLSATHYNKWLKTLVPTGRFQELLERTITFLRRLGPISPTCSHDCSILERIHRLIFGLSPDAKHLYRNEGVEPPSASTSFSHGT
ncbi:hypothetical protein LTR37_011187 [Vermiconidia calcicola]|uniref:Uncharacterized protein n=1 Tax=Vermiconidia calcicola TaxID=1690605 RepID=A0ACC3N2Z9_9PEZI|nr:hypothetical protein LTR37_011187 [Vermiconidia calcicola]